MTRALKYDIPGDDPRVSVEEAATEGWPAIFSSSKIDSSPLVVEIGFGRGEFLIDLATNAPEQAFIGVEYSFKRTLKMARRLARLDVPNVRVVGAKGQDLVAEAIADGSVKVFWINFPDPWPKKRHFKRRLIQKDFVALLASRLMPGGLLKIATDHRDYAEWVDEILREEPALANRYAPDPYRDREQGRLATAYELEWRALGRDFHFFEYERVAFDRIEGRGAELEG